MNFALFRMFFVKLPQNRHPERSASQIDRVTQRLRRGVEGPRRCLSYPCCSELFNHRARTGRPRYGLPPGAENKGLARVRRLNLYSRQPYRRALASPATWISVSCNITIKCVSQQILLSGFGGRKAPSSMGKISTAEVLRLRAQALCHAINR